MLIPIAHEWFDRRPSVDPMRYLGLRLTEDAAQRAGATQTQARAEFTAVALSITQAAEIARATDTRQRAQAAGTATQAAAAVNATGTAAAGAYQATHAIDEKQAAQNTATLWAGWGALVSFLVIIALGYGAYSLFGVWVDRRRAETTAILNASARAVPVNGGGYLVCEDGEYRYIPVNVPVNVPVNLPAQLAQLPPAPVNQGGVPTQSTVAIYTEEVLRAAIARCGGDADYIPSNDSIKVTSHRWTEATNALEKRGLITPKTTGVKTRISAGLKLSALLSLVLAGELETAPNEQAE
jgi:hypothetical protein